MTGQLQAAIVALALAAGAGPAAQHGAAPKAAPAQASEAKAPEPKAPDARRAAPASPQATAAAVEQILRKLRQESTKAPTARSGTGTSRQTARPRLRVAWRLSLNWPLEVRPP